MQSSDLRPSTRFVSKSNRLPWIPLVLLGALTCLSGCAARNGEPSDPPKSQVDLMMERQILAVTEVAQAMESGASDDVIASLNQNLDEAGQEWESSGLNETELDEAVQRYKEQYDKAMRRLTKASMKSGAEAL